MKAVRNNGPKSLTVSYEGLDYYFPKDKPVLLNENLYKHIKEIMPLAFKDYKPLRGEAITQVQSEKTKVYIKSKVENLKESSDAVFGLESDEGVSGKTDKDGVNWYGSGLEDDKV